MHLFNMYLELGCRGIKTKCNVALKVALKVTLKVALKVALNE
jgi:hypothetical protein